MGYQWSMAREDVDDEKAINSWLRQDFEPFGLHEGEIFFRKHVYTEDGNKATERESDRDRSAAG
jgi:hypothetical protein